MSINIPERILRVSKPVEVVIEMDKLTKIQRNKIPKMLRSRYIKGDAPPALIARHILKQHDVGFFHRATYHRNFTNLTPEDWDYMAEAIEQMRVEARLDDKISKLEQEHAVNKAKNEWYKDRLSPLEEFEYKLAQRGDNVTFGWAFMFMFDFFTARVRLPVNPTLDQVAKQFESGEITTMTILATNCF